jgi:hypothetical protein
VKLVWLVAVPSGVVTVMGPVAAPAGTLVTIWVAVWDTMVAGVPSNATAVALDRFWPVMVTVVAAAPEAGVKPLTAGVTVVVIRAISLAVLLNHSAPSGPAVICSGSSIWVRR